MTSLKEAALNYAKHGICVFPCQPNRKIPFGGGHGCKDATTGPAIIALLRER